MFRMSGFARVILMSLASLSAVVLLAQPASADWLAVTSAHPAAGVIVIDGYGFRNDVNVSVNDVELKVLSVSTREIKAALPPPGARHVSSGRSPVEKRSRAVRRRNWRRGGIAGPTRSCRTCGTHGACRTERTHRTRRTTRVHRVFRAEG